MTCSTHYW